MLFDTNNCNDALNIGPPINTLDTFDCIHVCLLNTLCPVNWNIVYVVESDIVFPRDINSVQTQNVVSELENAVELIDHINTLDTWRYICKILYRCVITCHAIYMRDWRETLTPDRLVNTIMPVDCEGTASKKELPLSDHYVTEYQKSSKDPPLCVDTLPLTIFLFSPTLYPFVRFEFKKWTHFTNNLLLFTPLKHMSTFFISLLLSFFYWLHFHLAARFPTDFIKLI